MSAGRTRFQRAASEYSVALKRLVGRELRPKRAGKRANIPLDLASGRASSSTTTTRATGHGQGLAGHRRRRGKPPVRARCPGDWDPGCLRSWLQDPDGNGIYSFETTALPQGSYEGKVAINESWDENYGQGVPNGPNIAFSVPVAGATVTFTYDASTHVLTIAANAPGAPGGPGALSHFDLARKDCLGTARNTSSKVWYTVANGVLSDVYYPTCRQHERRDAQYAVTDGATFTDLQTRDMTYAVRAVHNAGGMACEVTATAKSRAATGSRPSTSPT